jgi:hypothetical protein
MMGQFVSAFALGIAFRASPGPITAETLRRRPARGFRPALLVGTFSAGPERGRRPSDRRVSTAAPLPVL